MEGRPETLLKRHWGFDRFRPGQRAIIDAVLAGEPVLAVMPTGAGKSMCFQVPALMLDGLTLVVSPLIALMKDQVDGLNERGIPAAALNSSLDLEAQREILGAAQRGELKLLYVAPERFRYPGAMAALKRLPISLLAIDEAHCISQWGHDFRPDYQHLHEAWRELGRPRIAAFTATATPVVRRDILGSLGLAPPGSAPTDEARPAHVTVSGFLRPNLHLSVVPIKKMAEKPTWARDLLRAGLAAGGAAVVYCATRRHCEDAFAKLRAYGFRVCLYHGGLPDAERAAAQERFASEAGLVMVATNAFGMGVDRADVRLVIHWDLPGTVDAYYQEAGRAGRDGERAFAVLLFTHADVRIHEFFIRVGGESLPPDRYLKWAEAERHKLKAMVRFAYHEGCRHQALLRYFGETPRGCEPDVPDGAACDNCRDSLGLPGLRRPHGHDDRAHDLPSPRALTSDEKVIVQKVLSAIARASGALPDRSLVAVLRGAGDPLSASHPIRRSRSFGILKALPAATLQALLRALGEVGCWIGRNPRLTPLGAEVMWLRAEVHLALPPFAESETHTRRGTASRARSQEATPTLPPEAEGRLRLLKERRLEEARARNVPAFVVAPNKVLIQLAALGPGARREDWLSIRGVGEKNVDALRETFAQVLSD